MNNLKAQVSDETQGTNQSHLSRGSQFLVHCPETLPGEEQETDDTKNRDSIAEPECLEQDNHPISAALASNDNESLKAQLSLESSVFDMEKNTEMQELLEFCFGENDLGFLDSILKCQIPSAGSPSPGLQSISADHSEKEHSGDLESDLNIIPANQISTTDRSLSSGCQSLSSDYSEIQHDAPRHSHCDLSSPKSEILEMEDKSEMEVVCLSGHHDNDSNDAGRERLKQELSIGGESPSPDLESEGYDLSDKEQKCRNEYWAKRKNHCNDSSVASYEAAKQQGKEQLRLENKVEEESDLRDDDNNDNDVDLEHILDSVSNSKASTPDRSTSVGLELVCSNHSDQQQEPKKDLTASPGNEDCNISSIVSSKAECSTAQFNHLPENIDRTTNVEKWKELVTSLEKNEEVSQKTNGEYILLTDSGSTCNESFLEGSLSATTVMKKNREGPEIGDEFSEVSESSEFSESSESSTNGAECSVLEDQQSSLLKKLSSILDRSTFQGLLSVIKAYVVSLQQKKDHCEKLRAKFRQAEKENEKMSRLLKDTNYESSCLKQMIKELEVQRNVKVNKTANDESTYQCTKLENNKLILTSINLQNLLQDQVSIQNEINEVRNSSLKDLQKQSADLREELKLPRVYCSEENALLENIEILKEKLENASQDLNLNAMIIKDVCSYSNQTPTLKSELAAMTACLENERQAHELLKKELESTRLCLSETKKEVDLLQGKHRMENQHLKEEINILRGESKGFSRKLLIAVTHATDKENKISRISEQLKETTLQVEKLQLEKDQEVARIHELQKSLCQCREQLDQNRTYNEAREQQIQDLQEENNKLKANIWKVQHNLQQTLYKFSASLENSIHQNKAMEQEKAELIKKLDRLKREVELETMRANQNKEEMERLDLHLKEELLKNMKCQNENWKLRNLTKSTKKMLHDQRIHEAEMVEIKEMMSMLQIQLTKEKARCCQLEENSKQLKEELDQQVRINNMLKDDLQIQGEQTEKDLQTLQQRLQAAEQLLLSQSEASEENKQTFAETMLQHEQTLKKKEKELMMLNESYISSCANAERYQKLYNDETRHRLALESQLRMAQVQLQTSNYA